MNIIFYRYGSICESSIIDTFKTLGFNVIEETAEITNKNITPSECVEILNTSLQKYHPVFVFSINFYPAIAEICHIYGTFYLCWTVDSPVIELFSTSILYDTNRIFLFDKAQYDLFHPYNPSCIFHLPLASATEHFDNVINQITSYDKTKYSSDISFIGSLYIEKNPLRSLNLSEYTKGYISGVISAAIEIYGYNLIEETITSEVIDDIFSNSPFAHSSDKYIMSPAKYITAHYYIGMQAAETERIRTLNELAKHFNVDLYTRSQSNSLKHVNVHDGIKTLSEMPKAFHLSKINLNMTIKPIQSGLPLRIFDIMGCGGFLMTNFQPELQEHFEIGVDLEAYSSLEELVDKCSFYLENPQIREKIALTGYEKVKKYHNYQQRILQMLKTIT